MNLNRALIGSSITKQCTECHHSAVEISKLSVQIIVPRNLT
jgi:hypothetical protein